MTALAAEDDHLGALRVGEAAVLRERLYCGLELLHGHIHATLLLYLEQQVCQVAPLPRQRPAAVRACVCVRAARRGEGVPILCT